MTEIMKDFWTFDNVMLVLRGFLCLGYLVVACGLIRIAIGLRKSLGSLTDIKNELEKSKK